MYETAKATSLDFNADSGYCPYCSNPPYHYVYHGGACPLVKAKEYHRNGTLKRIEFHKPQPATINVETPVLPERLWWGGEIEIKKPVLLEPGRYTIVDRELRKLEDDVPPGLGTK